MAVLPACESCEFSFAGEMAKALPIGNRRYIRLETRATLNRHASRLAAARRVRFIIVSGRVFALRQNVKRRKFQCEEISRFYILGPKPIWSRISCPREN